MVILEAEIELQNIYNSAQSFQNAHIRLAISFDGHTVHESMISSKNGSHICFERRQNVIITIPTGECSLNYMEENKRIDLYCGKKIGYGFVKHIREIYIEYENLKLLNNINQCNQIVRKAENMEVALIYEEVYSLL